MPHLTLALEPACSGCRAVTNLWPGHDVGEVSVWFRLDSDCEDHIDEVHMKDIDWFIYIPVKLSPAFLSWWESIMRSATVDDFDRWLAEERDEQQRETAQWAGEYVKS
jgi:hypothetical protein